MTRRPSGVALERRRSRSRSRPGSRRVEDKRGGGDRERRGQSTDRHDESRSAGKAEPRKIRDWREFLQQEDSARQLQRVDSRDSSRRGSLRGRAQEEGRDASRRAAFNGKAREEGRAREESGTPRASVKEAPRRDEAPRRAARSPERPAAREGQPPHAARSSERERRASRDRSREPDARHKERSSCRAASRERPAPPASVQAHAGAAQQEGAKGGGPAPQVQPQPPASAVPEGDPTAAPAHAVAPAAGGEPSLGRNAVEQTAAPSAATSLCEWAASAAAATSRSGMSNRWDDELANGRKFKRYAEQARTRSSTSQYNAAALMWMLNSTVKFVHAALMMEASGPRGREGAKGLLLQTANMVDYAVDSRKMTSDMHELLRDTIVLLGRKFSALVRFRALGLERSELRSETARVAAALTRAKAAGAAAGSSSDAFQRASPAESTISSTSAPGQQLPDAAAPANGRSPPVGKPPAPGGSEGCGSSGVGDVKLGAGAVEALLKGLDSLQATAKVLDMLHWVAAAQASLLAKATESGMPAAVHAAGCVAALSSDVGLGPPVPFVNLGWQAVEALVDLGKAVPQ